jgi:hypothetical protein
MMIRPVRELLGDFEEWLAIADLPLEDPLLEETAESPGDEQWMD